MPGTLQSVGGLVLYCTDCIPPSGAPGAGVVGAVNTVSGRGAQCAGLAGVIREGL